MPENTQAPAPDTFRGPNPAIDHVPEKYPDVISDEVWNRHLNPSDDDTDLDSDSPDELEEDTDDGDDQPELRSETDEEDTDEDEDGDLESAADEEDEDEDLDPAESEEDEEDTEDDESFLPEFDRKKFLTEHPELEPAYKHFQAAFTKRTQELAAQTRQAEAVQTQYRTFAQQLSTDEGLGDFLLNIALARPEVFDGVYDRALTLNEDETEKKAYLQERELKTLKSQREREVQDRQMTQLQQRAEELTELTHNTAKRLGLESDEEINLAEELVAKRIYELQDEDQDIDPKEVVAIVKRVAQRLNANREKVKASTKKELRKKSLEAAKRTARDAKRPSPPKGGGSPSSKPKAKDDGPKRWGASFSDDPLDRLVDERLGNLS